MKKGFTVSILPTVNVEKRIKVVGEADREKGNVFSNNVIIFRLLLQ